MPPKDHDSENQLTTTKEIEGSPLSDGPTNALQSTKAQKEVLDGQADLVLEEDTTKENQNSPQVTVQEPEKAERTDYAEAIRRYYASKCDGKAKFSYKIGAAVQGTTWVVNTLLKKFYCRQNLMFKDDVLRPATGVGIQVLQIELERYSRKSIKVANPQKKLGFCLKLSIVVGGTAVMHLINEFVINDEKGNDMEKLLKVCEECIYSALGFAKSYYLSKGAKILMENAIKDGTNIIAQGLEKPVWNAAINSGTQGIIGFVTGMVIDSVRIICSKSITEKKAAFKQSLKNNACSAVGQVIGAFLGSFFGPIGSAVGGCLGGAAGSLFVDIFLRRT